MTRGSLALLAVALLLVAQAHARVPGEALRRRGLRAAPPVPKPPPLLTHEGLCKLLASAAPNSSLLLAADPGTFSGVPEVKYLLENAKLLDNSAEGSSASCPLVAVGTLLGQPVVMGTTGIGPVAASACTSELLSCAAAADLREVLWLGTSGWSPQPGGVLNADDCSEANQDTDVTRVGDVCVSPFGVGWCFKASWTAQASGYPNQCFQPPAVPGPEADFLFGNCTFSTPTPESLALADELVAAARAASYADRPASLAATEEEYWGEMRNGTGVDYTYDAAAPPAIRDYTECAEIASESFWSAHPWDAQARLFVSQLISKSGVANVTQKDVIAVSAMEARGFLNAIYAHGTATGSTLAHTIVRAASNLDSLMPVARSPDDPSVWVAGPTIEEDISVGYAFAIGTSSTAVLNLFRLRCLDAGGSKAECSFKL